MLFVVCLFVCLCVVVVVAVVAIVVVVVVVVVVVLVVVVVVVAVVAVVGCGWLCLVVVGGKMLLLVSCAVGGQPAGAVAIQRPAARW